MFLKVEASATLEKMPILDKTPFLIDFSCFFLTDFCQNMKNSAFFDSSIPLKIESTEKVLYTMSKRRP
jgi:hypothetical protein